ncbi:MAG: MFS transporter, partial [Acidimicrobiia bacterium]
MSTVTGAPAVIASRTQRRLLPLQLAMVLQGFLLWVPIEKLFMTEIGFTPVTVGVMAAAYAAVVPLVEFPSGILADRWSRRGVMVIGALALAVSSLVGGLSNNVATYIAGAMILGIYFAMNSGTIDAVVYDTVLEETGASDTYERHIGRVRLMESLAFVLSALVGGLVAEWTSTRVTYFATIPTTLLAIVAFLAFREPQLHRAMEPESLRRHIAITLTT